jgi:hypothetical protein
MPIQNQPFMRLHSLAPSRPYLRIRIINPENGRFFDSLGQIDTGADVCTFPSQIATVLGHDLEAGQASHSGTANGLARTYSHTTTIEVLTLAGDILLTIQNIQAHYMRDLHTCLIGVDQFLGRYHLQINYPKQIFSITTS